MSASWRIIEGDCRQALATLPERSVQTCVTSPPYFGLRDYGHDGQIGLEPTPDEFVAAMVAVFREVRRVLRDDGTVWLNLGDSYAGSYGNQGRKSERGSQRPINGEMLTPVHDGRYPSGGSGTGAIPAGADYKAKDLLGVPWMVAFALRADGWYLRSDIIWSKPNPMPESVTDRPTKAHETIFLLSKRPRYYFDADAIREGVAESGVVERADGHSQPLVLRHDLGLEHSSSSCSAVGVRLASAVLDLAERQDEVGLLAFDPEVGVELANDGAGSLVVGVPVIRRAASQASRFADGDVSAKEFLREMDSLCVALPDGDDLKEAWRRALRRGAGAVPSVDADGDRAVRVDDAGKVGQLQRVHNEQSTGGRTRSCDRKSDAAGVNGRNVQATNAEAERRDVVGGSFNNNPRLRPDNGRNRRSVWTVATQPFPGAHFATFPPKLIEPCILAGSAPGDVVLDPFSGSGTTGMVALRHARSYVGCELNADYVELARRRICDDAPLLNTWAEAA